jgi:hypothetical protein
VRTAGPQQIHRIGLNPPAQVVDESFHSSNEDGSRGSINGFAIAIRNPGVGFHGQACLRFGSSARRISSAPCGHTETKAAAAHLEYPLCDLFERRFQRVNWTIFTQREDLLRFH